jgi:hypothetical protein
MKTIINLSFATLLMTSLMLSSCRKEKETDNDTSSASDNNLAENLFAQVKNISDAAADGTMSSSVYKSSRATYDTAIIGCATIIHDTTVSPRTLSIDYGPTNCTCGDGRKRRGKILVSYTGPYHASGTVITHSFDNFFIDDNQILGSKIVTNAGLNGAGNIHFTVSVNGSIIKSGGGTITWTSTRDREWIAGSGTLTWTDDIYLITGSANGTRADGSSFSAAITSPLQIELCTMAGTTYPRHRITSGTINVTPSGKPVRVIDYGTGACDNQATVTVNGNVYNITLW